MPLAAEIMMLRGCPPAVAGLAWAFSETGLAVARASAPAISEAEVTATPERKSLRFMRPLVFQSGKRRRITESGDRRHRRHRMIARNRRNRENRELVISSGAPGNCTQRDDDGRVIE